MVPTLLRRPALASALKICLGLGAVALLGLALLWATWSALTGEPAKGDEGIILFDDQGRLYSVKPDGSDRKDYSKNDKDSPILHGTRLSPNGKQILYGIRTPGKEEQGDVLYMRGLNDPHPKESLGVQAGMWWWSPDGKEVLILQIVDDGTKRIPVNYLLNVETRKKTKLEVPANHSVTDLSPDGKSLLTMAVERGADNKQMFHLHLMRRDGSDDRVLATPGLQSLLGRLSPDGKTVLFLGVDADKPEIHGLYVMDLDGGKPQRVKDAADADVMGCTWSPDGKRIGFILRKHAPKAEPDAETESWLIVADADGTNAKTIVTAKGKGNQPTLASPDWR